MGGVAGHSPACLLFVRSNEGSPFRGVKRGCPQETAPKGWVGPTSVGRMRGFVRCPAGRRRKSALARVRSGIGRSFGRSDPASREVRARILTALPRAPNGRFAADRAGQRVSAQLMAQVTI